MRISPSATPATQNDMTTCVESFEKERFSIDTTTAEEKQRIETKHVGASKRAFCETSSNFHTLHLQNRCFPTNSLMNIHEPQNLLPQNPCFARGFRQFSSHLTKCHAGHAICTLSPLDAALTMVFAKNTQRDTSEVLRLSRKMMMEVAKVLHLPRKCNTSSENVAKKDCACHTKRFSTRYETRLNVTKCHACHAKRSYAALGTSKSDHFCTTRHRHGHTALTRPPANGCGRLRNVWRTQPQPPDPQSETGTFATHSGKILGYDELFGKHLPPNITYKYSV